MENQIESMRGAISQLKNVPKEKKKKVKQEKAPVASSSKASASKPPKAAPKKKGRKAITDDDVLTFEQKKELSEAITKLDGTKLEKVIQIIHEGVPEIRDVCLFLFSLLVYLINKYPYRAPKRLNSRSIHYQPQFSHDYTTSSFDR